MYCSRLHIRAFKIKVKTSIRKLLEFLVWIQRPPTKPPNVGPVMPLISLTFWGEPWPAFQFQFQFNIYITLKTWKLPSSVHQNNKKTSVFIYSLLSSNFANFYNILVTTVVFNFVLWKLLKLWFWQKLNFTKFARVL